MEQEKLKVEESLNIISEMVNSSKYNLSEDKGIYLMWGYAVAISAIIHYILQFHLEFKEAHYVWLSMPVLGVINTVYFARKSKKKKVYTYIDRALSYIWLGFLFVILALLVISPQFGMNVVYPIFMFLYGIATISTAGIIKFKPLAIGGVISVLCGIVAAYLNFEYQILLLAFAIVCSFVIPGHLLKNTK
ncbi:hypothetical protein QYS49_31115 [Marivirga salinae]|uniref:Uncharacterized protein n=1 Tax=Marivirga salinarum TaxID=3059078 RepID=A0AA49GGR0_9BACT|nr:hypothetical protein [Marivirga sp. BDSF4-3]WKK75822.2 hypothetical protein QYS49_31115 [Marivirga sp. BDSF4-3]